MRDERIQKVMAEQGVCSRRAAEQMIADGRVKLNGRPVALGDKMDPARDLLTVDGQRVAVPRRTEKYYYMLHKPRGYITTTSDERGRKTVMELLGELPARVYPVGRLDKDSEGLLLLTNDGEFANLLTHPSHGVSKLYRVTVRPRASEEQLVALTDGVVLDDGSKTQPAVIRVVTDEPERTVMEMTIREGKNRQIRRMCEAVGLDVIRLRRTAQGPVKLGMLQPGEYRELTAQEVRALRTAATKGKNAARQSAGEGEGADEPRRTRRASADAPVHTKGVQRAARRPGAPAPRHKSEGAAGAGTARPGTPRPGAARTGAQRAPKGGVRRTKGGGGE